MANPLDPRRLLKQISNRLLRAFFARHGVLEDLAWEQLPETRVEPVFVAWQALPDGKRKEIQVALEDIHNLADGRGLKIFAEEIQRTCPQLVSEFAALEGRLDRAVWAYLQLPEAFEQAALFARADALANGRYWVKRNGLPRGPVPVDGHILRALQEELRDHYWPAELRGKHCRVEQYDRANGAQYFFAYLDDWPDKQLVFADNGEMVPRSERFAFSNLFVFNPHEGSLELVAKGGAAVQLPLQQAFCRSALGLDVGPADPLRPAYQLDVLLKPGFRFVTDPADRVAHVFLRRIRVRPLVYPGHFEHLEVKFHERTDLPDVLEAVQEGLARLRANLSQVQPRQASFQVVFLPDAQHRAKQMTFSVAVPNTCNLKSKPDELRLVGERCLKLWGIAND